MAGVEVTGQYLSAVTSESSEFSEDPADGLIGLAFPAISNLGHVHIFCLQLLQVVLASCSMDGDIHRSVGSFFQIQIFILPIIVFRARPMQRFSFY